MRWWTGSSRSETGQLTMTTKTGDTEATSVRGVASPKLSLGGWARWAWRQLTSMNTALVLLLLLAVAAIPGSLVPQRSADPNGVAQYFTRDPNAARVLDMFSAFDVYTSPWFSAIYLLLMVSLIGCLVPRIRYHVRALTAPPPRTPTNMDRLPVHVTARSDAALTDLHATAWSTLRSFRYRVHAYPGDHGQLSLAAERGYLRETGNILFHVAITVAIIALAVGSGLRHTGQRVLVEGQSFTNTRLAYDTYTAGPLVSDDSLTPFALTLDKLTVTYVTDNPAAFGMPRGYDARVSVTRPDDTATPGTANIRVNEPLDINGTNIYLLGNGYAPRIIVKDPRGNVVFDDMIPFLPQDANLTSLGVVKVPDGLREQIGMTGFLYPTPVTTRSGAAASALPILTDPVVTLNVYSGDLGLDNTTASNAYRLDTSKMTQLAGPGAPAAALTLTPGVSQQLPDGLGSIEISEIRRFASFELTSDPIQGVVLAAALTALAGVLAALFVPRRRIWVRFTPTAGTTRIDVAGLARGHDPGLEAAVRDLTARIIPPPPPQEKDT